jgi:predicted glycogen debranching enzyme
MEPTPATVDRNVLPEPIVVPCRGREFRELIGREWLVNNRIGAYASSTVVGCNTRRYHGLLVASTRPPMGRLVALSLIAERLLADGESHDLATIEFPGVVKPEGFRNLVEFRNDLAPMFVYRIGRRELTKELILAESANAVCIRYTLRGGEGVLRLLPFAALRDFHHLRKAHDPHQMTFETTESGAVVQDRQHAAPPLYLAAKPGRFEPDAQWWFRFHYRLDLARGQDAFEDLYAPGAFLLDLADGRPVELIASLSDPRPLDFDEIVSRKGERIAEIVQAVGPQADTATRRLAAASDAFIVQRAFPNQPSSWTILAGYHWFADWGRDAFIALPGLLLATGRYAVARDVFRTFAENIAGGMIPNRFDDYSPAAHYNSIDASLWFIIAAERFLQATGDTTFWRTVLMPAAAAILRAYQEGTQFDIHADADGLLMGGSRRTQLTWMDAALGEEVVTPRHGKCIEINALWYCAHRMLADRCREIDPELAEHCQGRATLIAAALNKTFWHPQAECLFDCVRDEEADATIRPNQIFAVSLPYSALSADRQRSVVRVVQEQLLTPMGLRTLSPGDPRYRRRYGGSWESRDRSYHQGTVWPWLLGPFLEAYLRVHENKPFAVAQARQWIGAFDAHLETAGLGYISEICDGDPPHEPRGCVAQAWSVGEVLRIQRMLQELPGGSESAP